MGRAPTDPLRDVFITGTGAFLIAKQVNMAELLGKTAAWAAALAGA